MKYEPTDADRRPLPAPWFTEARYLGYRDGDRVQPWASYMRDASAPVQGHVHDAMVSSPVSSEFGVRASELADHMRRPGYRHLETGYTVNSDGDLVIAILTDMPGVTGEMWDWWFGWHGSETSRYKLWHPDAHLFAAWGEDRSADRTLSDRQRYVNNVSYVTEYIGMETQELAIRFLDPEKTAFGPSKPGETTILVRAGSPLAPAVLTHLVHQVRATPEGSEMRSRFIIGAPEMLKLPATSISGPGKLLTFPPARPLGRVLVPRMINVAPAAFAPPMIQHCATEMNHLAQFLPALYEEFGDMP